MSAYPPLTVPQILQRPTTTVLPAADGTPSFLIDNTRISYKHQYSNIYFIRLRKLREAAEQNAHRKWRAISGNPILIERVLEVEKGRLCYIVGTVYMDMPLKPNVIEDVARDHSIPPPPPPVKFFSQQDNVMLEDESGRIKLVGESIKDAGLATGVIMAALGMETPSGEFEVVDFCFAGMAPQQHEIIEDQMDVNDGENEAEKSQDEWIAVVSGLEIGSASPADAQIQMLVEYLTGEGGAEDDQVTSSQISRLIIAGNSLSPTVNDTEPLSSYDERKSRRFATESTSFSLHPILSLSSALQDIVAVMPVHILPGHSDPSGVILPQQAFPHAMFGDTARYSTFSCETNPTYLTLSTQPSSKPRPIKRTCLINSGQPLNDIFKYLPTPPHTRLSMLESTLRWRHMAPTAPDTLWCHPYRDDDPFIIRRTPDIYIVGGQTRFGTRLVTDRGDENEKGIPFFAPTCRLILVPSFALTGILVLVNLRTLGVKRVNFMLHGRRAAEMMSTDEQDKLPSLTPAEPMASAPRSSLDYGFF